MKNFFPSDSCRETQLKAINPQSWLQVERGKLPKFSSSSSSIDSLIKVTQPPILPHFKPVDYVEVLSQIHEELEFCPPTQRSYLHLLQFHVFKGLGEAKLMQRSLCSAFLKAETVYDKLIFGAWLKYEKQGQDSILDLVESCGKCANELFGVIDVASELPPVKYSNPPPVSYRNSTTSRTVAFQIGREKILCDRKKIATLSSPFRAMLNGCFKESYSDEIDLSENDISPMAFKLISEFTFTNTLDREVTSDLLLEILVFSNKFCCEGLKDTCDRKLSSLVSSRRDAVYLMEWALQEDAPVLAASCLQVILRDLPESLNDSRVVELLSNTNSQQNSTMAGPAVFSLYCFLSEVAIGLDPRSETGARFLKRLVDCSETDRQKMVACHQLGCIRFLRKEYDDAEVHFQAAFDAGHTYSIVGLARVMTHIKGSKSLAYEKLSLIISSTNALGWMYQERSLHCEGNESWDDLERATELDPTLTYPYMYRASSFMRKQNVQNALTEINRVIGFKLALECLELRFCIYLAVEDYQSALCDVQAILTLCPEYRMFEGRVPAFQLRTLVREHVEDWTEADCWMQLYERWSLVDDIGSLSVIYQMLESDSPKGVLYFRQSLLLLRLNCPEAAMRSLELARRHASSDHERLVYEGWMLYDTGHYEEGLRKADESIRIKRSFEAFFLKAYALADSSLDPSCSSTVISLLEEALRCPSDRLRKGQALNNLGSVYVDCENLDAAVGCYTRALEIRHTRAHQGLARVHFLRNDKTAAYNEMTKLIENSKNNASAYEKRSEYCERELTIADLEMATRLDPLRVYPYRYRAAVLMDNRKEKEAVAELTRAIAFKADLHLLHLRAAFHEHIGDVIAALRDCRAALSVDPNHQEMLELHSRVSAQEP
ncbi:hypothetical protein DM860_012623 [Cuscuta australis]|uniref:BTB domain-containing protein n=1 Tax=Cuscuta australis TaxID=267555 RepID=A0A328DCB9_9ASTE|nr:hypothetical protein DM860_012623 [Cuscuta australis]